MGTTHFNKTAVSREAIASLQVSSAKQEIR